MLADDWQRIVTALADAVYEMRMLLGWSQQGLADRAVTSQGAISRLESGKHHGLPFHTVVLVLHTLGSAAAAASIPLSPIMHAFITVTTIGGGFTVVEPDADLLALAQMFNRMPIRRRAAFVAFVRSAAHLVDLTEGEQHEMDTPVLRRRRIARPRANLPAMPAPG